MIGGCHGVNFRHGLYSMMDAMVIVTVSLTGAVE
jgi:hypothetical protein